MSRYVKRVPKDFNFPLDQSYSEHVWREHDKTCSKEDHNDCGIRDDPPEGEGWQLWQGVSDGPISPVFDTDDALIDWMSQPVPMKDRPYYDPSPYPDHPKAQGWQRKAAEGLVKGLGWIPSGGGLAGGPTFTTAELVEHCTHAASPDK